MANVKITDLTALAATDVASNDVLPIVDINVDQTKKIAISELITATSASNDFITFTRLNSNLNVLDANADAIEARRVANVTVMTTEDTALQARITANNLVAASNDFITFTRLNANINVVQDNVAGLTSTLTIRGDNASDDAVTLGSETLTFKGDTGLTTTVSSNTVTIDLDDTAVTAGLYGGVSGGTTNVAAVTIDATGRITNAANVSVVTDLDTIQDNVVRVQQNAAANTDAVEARRVANIAGAISTVLTADLTASRAMVTNGSGKIAISDVTATELAHLDGVSGAIQTQIDSKIATTDSASNDFITFTRLNANINTVSSNAAAVETRRAANIAGAVSTITTSDLTASRAMVTNSSGKVAVSAVTATELGHLDGVTSAIQTQFTGAETRRTNNIAGAVSTITTADLTADRALISTGAGKVGVSAVTATEIGHLDGVSGAIQTQLDAKAALAGATFTGQVNMSDDLVVTGNLTVNGDTTTVSSTNLDVEDRMIMLADGVTGSPSADVGLLFNRGNQGNAAFFYDESASTFKLSDTKDPKSNTSLSPVTASNLNLGIITAATVKQDGANLNDLISSNVDGAISTVNDTDLTASRALASSGAGKIEVSAVTATELGYLDGVTGAIQTQIDAVESRRNANTVTATISDDLTITGNATIGKGFGVGGNTLPATDTISLGTPANVVIRSVGGKGGNVIIGDATATSSHLLDVRGTANTGALTATAITLGSTNLQSNLESLASGIAGAAGGTFPTGDYGLLDSANVNADAFLVVIGGLTTFDMKNAPAGSVATEDLGALS